MITPRERDAQPESKKEEQKSGNPHAAIINVPWDRADLADKSADLVAPAAKLILDA